jgi:hypothetical protein
MTGDLYCAWWVTKHFYTHFPIGLRNCFSLGSWQNGQDLQNAIQDVGQPFGEDRAVRLWARPAWDQAPWQGEPQHWVSASAWWVLKAVGGGTHWSRVTQPQTLAPQKTVCRLPLGVSGFVPGTLHCWLWHTFQGNSRGFIVVHCHRALECLWAPGMTGDLVASTCGTPLMFFKQDRPALCVRATRWVHLLLHIYQGLCCFLGASFWVCGCSWTRPTGLRTTVSK